MAVDAHHLHLFMRNSEIMNALVMASESGVAVNEASAPPRKRQRSFIGGDVCLQIQQQQQQQLDIDRLIAKHAEELRAEMAERLKRLASHILEAVEEGVSRRLRGKEEEIESIGRLNWALEERVKSLSAENQVWREMAQRSEAAATVLRSNLEQVLASATQERGSRVAEDAESCFGDSEEEEEEKRRMRRCWRCGEGEAAVLLMPCRHLCVCVACGGDVEVCPVCKCRRNGSLVVNLP